MDFPNSFTTLAALFEVEQLALLIPIAGIALGGVIVVSALHFQHQRRRLWHDTARIALEKGQPLPPIPEEENFKKDPAAPTNAYGDIRVGLILIGVGVGLFLFLGNFINRGLGYVGAIPGFIGVGLFVFGVIRVLTEKKITPASSSAESLRP